MRLINLSKPELEFFYGDDIPPYAILSHRWEGEEVTFSMFNDSTHNWFQTTPRGWAKVENCCRKARAYGYEYVWIDTCCIDVSSSAELSEAINSMFRWYANAGVCLVYMSDVFAETNSSMSGKDSSWTGSNDTSMAAFKQSEWFSRGWTLQELIAPSKVIFFDRSWTEIGDRETLSLAIYERTQISLQHYHDVKRVSVAQRMYWASGRRTSREEDLAYCLLGLFDVNMPLLYGEGAEKAFLRLQNEILRQNDDESIFAWERDGTRSGLLAIRPQDFSKSNGVYRFMYSKRSPFFMTNKGLYWKTKLYPYWPYGAHGNKFWAVALNCANARIPSRSFLTIYLAREMQPSPPRIYYTDQYCKIGPLETHTEAELVQMSRGSVIEEREVYVRQTDRFNWQMGFEGWNSHYNKAKCHDPKFNAATWRLSRTKKEEQNIAHYSGLTFLPSSLLEDNKNDD